MMTQQQICHLHKGSIVLRSGDAERLVVQSRTHGEEPYYWLTFERTGTYLGGVSERTLRTGFCKGRKP